MKSTHIKTIIYFFSYEVAEVNRHRQALTGFPCHATGRTGPYHGGSVAVKLFDHLLDSHSSVFGQSVYG